MTKIISRYYDIQFVEYENGQSEYDGLSYLKTIYIRKGVIKFEDNDFIEFKVLSPQDYKGSDKDYVEISFNEDEMIVKKRHFENGVLHRIDGPAVSHYKGDCCQCRCDDCDCEFVSYPLGGHYSATSYDLEYWLNGVCIRTDPPNIWDLIKNGFYWQDYVDMRSFIHDDVMFYNECMEEINIFETVMEGAGLEYQEYGWDDYQKMMFQLHLAAHKDR